MLAIGCDHGGFELKEAIIKHLKERDIEFYDFGIYENVSVNYPEIGVKVARAIAEKKYDRGILVCGTGIGISLAANKVKGIRAAVLSDEFSCEFTRRHNDANILCLGGRVVSPEQAIKLVDIFLDTPFEGGRHQTRVDMITAIENGEM